MSNSLEGEFCQDALLEALNKGKPTIFNSDQGSQFTSPSFTGLLESRDIRVSMDGRGRAIDNVFIERFWRSLKYEEVYLRAYQDGREAYENIDRYISYYNYKRPHMALEYKTPADVYGS